MPNDPSQPARGKHLRILCAEDDPNMRRLLSLVLSTAGHSVETSADGLEALDKVVSGMHAFDLIITDHYMPGFDGLNFVRQLRSESYPGKIIVLAGTLSPKDRLAYLGLFVDAILRKPVRNEMLIKTIADVSGQLPDEA